MTTKQLKLRWVEAEVLKPYFRNTKIHSEEQLRKMAKVIDRFYFDQPIVVTPDMVIIKGHGRYMASLLMTKKSLVPIIVRDDLTPEQIIAARISDNRMFDLGVTMPDIIQSEVVDFVSAGGMGASDFFDFVEPDKKEKPAAAVPLQDLIAPVEKSLLAEDEGGVAEIAERMAYDDEELVKGEDSAPAKTNNAMAGIRCPNCNTLHKG